MFGLLSGAKLYVLAAIGIVVAGLSLACYVLYQKAEISEARAKDALGQRDRAIAAAKANEATIKLLEVRRDALDKTLVAQNKRERALQAKAAELKRELDDAKSKLSEEDKACLDRSLPDPLASRLLDS